MSKVHITLVGAQPLPVFYGIKATNPDRVVYIYSTQTEAVKNYVQAETRLPEGPQQPLDETDPVRIKARAESLAEVFRDDEVSLNIAGGLKSWAYLFGMVFGNRPNATVLYVDQNNHLWNYRTMSGRDLSADYYDMDVLFRLYGNPLVNKYTKLSDYTESDMSFACQVENVRAYNYTDFNKLTTVLSDSLKNRLQNERDGKWDLMSEKQPSMSYVEWEKADENGNEFVRLCLYRKNKEDNVTCEGECPHALNIAFNAGWFEYKVARMLARWKPADQIRLNCRFPFKNGIDKNEVDIIVDSGTKPLFVECKTQIKHSVDIDKFASVVKNYGGTGSKGIFITCSDMDDVAKEKCRTHHLLSYCIGKKDEVQAIKELMDILDREITNINSK